MTELMIKANDIDIWTEDFGDPSHTPLLLIMGATASGIYWHEEFVQRLVEQERYVIRYDNRDTGQSTCFDFQEAPYTLDDMAADAVGVLDAYDIASADVAGASMGGMIVQALALQHRGRIRSATIIMSSPLSGGGEQPELSADDLPGPDPAWMTKSMAIQMNPAETREERIEQRVQLFGMLSGSAEEFDTERQRSIATREADRANDFNAMNNHALAIGVSTPIDRRSGLSRIDVPALVIHGTEDPILPYAHGVSLAETIPGAKLLTLDRAGHEMPDMYVDEIVDAMIKISGTSTESD